MTVNTQNTKVAVPAGAPSAKLNNGDTAALVISDQSTVIGALLEPYCVECLASDPTTFYADSADSAALQSNADQYDALAVLMNAAGLIDPANGTVTAAYAQTWLASQTYNTAIKQIKAALAPLAAKLLSDVEATWPGTANANPPPVSTAVPADPTALLNWWLSTYVTLNHNTASDAVTATYTPPT